MKLNDIKKHITRSRKALKSAKFLVSQELNEDAISRAYYAILHAAKAALLIHDQIPKSHSAARNLFGKCLVKTNLIEIDVLF